MQARSARGSAQVVLGFVGLVCAREAGAASPKVCGNDPALGSFDPASCPLLKDDGVAPDEVAGDGIYSAQVGLGKTTLLEYKLLPNGVFDGTQLGQRGDCDAGGMHGNTFGNIQIADPDTSRPVRFYYDSRNLSADPSYASPPNNRSGGDDLMVRSPAAACPRWLAVGDFQNVPFDRAVGAVELSLQSPGVLGGRLTASKAVASGWRWKILQDGAAGTPLRRYGPSGWADEPCDTDNVTVGRALSPGDVVYFTWHSALGRLQTQVFAPADDPPDGGVHGGLPLCPPPAQPTDLGVPPDLSGGPPGPADLATGAPVDASGDGGPARPLPGIHCNCQVAGASAAPPGWLGLSVATLLLVRQSRRRRAVRREKTTKTRAQAESAVHTNRAQPA